MVLTKVKRWLGLEELSDYERHTLEQEYHRIEEKIASIERQMGTVTCKSCPKSLDPEAERLVAKKRAHEDRKAEIERRLGGAPEPKQRSSRRTSKRRSGA